MNDYLTLTISKAHVDFVLWGLLFICILAMLYNLIRMISNEFERIKREERQLIAKPYADEYDRLIRDGKSKEALTFAKKYDKYLKERYYYW